MEQVKGLPPMPAYLARSGLPIWPSRLKCDGLGIDLSCGLTSPSSPLLLLSRTLSLDIYTLLEQPISAGAISSPVTHVQNAQTELRSERCNLQGAVRPCPPGT